MTTFVQAIFGYVRIELLRHIGMSREARMRAADLLSFLFTINAKARLSINEDQTGSVLVESNKHLRIATRSVGPEVAKSRAGLDPRHQNP